MSGINSQNPNCESQEKLPLDDKKSVISRTINGVCALAVAVTLNVATPKEVNAQTNNKPVVVELVQNNNTRNIPAGATKVILRGSEFFVWKNEKGTFSLQFTKQDKKRGTDDIYFTANVGGENYSFSMQGMELIAEKVQNRTSAYGIDYDRMTRGNSILKDIMLSSEEKMANYYKTKGYDQDRIKRTLEGIAGIMTRDTLTKPQYEDFKAAYPEILTAFLYLDNKKFPNLYKVGELEAATQQAQAATQQAQTATERAQTATERAQTATQQANDWKEINRKLGGNK